MVDTTADPNLRRRPSSMTTVYAIALALLVIGGINWGLVGLFGFDLVAAIFGDMSALSRVVYVLVGIAALVSLGAFGRLRA